MDSKELIEKAFMMCETDKPENIVLSDFDGVKVKLYEGGAEIGYKTVPQLMRGCMLVAKAIKEGKKEYGTEEHPRFKTCGAMIDVSRNGVMRIEKVCEFIDFMALYGLNMLMLYTEDTYEVEGYEMFGYQRGRYTKDELKAIDSYGKAMGVEIIPCVQTLAHLSHYTKWGEGMRLSDRPGILCANFEPVYEFIEKCVATLRECFTSDRIHIGMDEAFEIGRGKYLDRFGLRDRKEIITEHLIKVDEICKKYGYKPMIWSDMYFRYPGKVGDFHRESTVAPEIADKIPENTEFVYWDYYNTEKDFYSDIMKKHEEINKKPCFAGGIWTWNGFLPIGIYTEKTTESALKAAIEHKIDTCFATLWSNDGCETSHFMGMGLMAYYSEFCYRGEDVTREEVYEMGEFVSGFQKDFYDACSDFHIARDVSKDSFMLDYYPVGKKLVWADILHGIHGCEMDSGSYVTKMKNAKALMDEYASGLDKNEEYYIYASLLFEIAGIKCDIFSNIKKHYDEGDRAYFDKLSGETLPYLYELYERLSDIHETMWLATYKPHGLEVIQMRYAATLKRLEYTKKVLEIYALGESDKIEELEGNHIYGKGTGKGFMNVYTPCW